MMQPSLIEDRETAGATFDSTRTYRYQLWREWGDGVGVCTFVMLNPSTADECILDATVRRCLGFARAWGYRRLNVANLFALRSTDPRALYTAADPVGTENNEAIVDAARIAAEHGGVVIAAWGLHGALFGRGEHVRSLLRLRNIPLHHLGLTTGGHPRHPLYLPKRAKPTEWR